MAVLEMSTRAVPKRLPPLPSIGDIIRLYGLSAKSQLSQNFLLDLNVTNKLVRVAGKMCDATVLEVGPGPGAVTRSILREGTRHTVVVEKDRRFLPSLELLRDASQGRLHIIHGDILEFDVQGAFEEHVTKVKWENDPPPFHIIGNLPFNVSIPLLLRWLALIPQRTGPFAFGRTQMTLTFQKEVAERITAPPGHTQRSRLSIMAQHLCHIKWGFKIPGSVFVPPPKVDAVVLKFTPLVVPAIDVDYSTLETVVKALFHYRRKYIKKAAGVLFPGSPEVAEDLFMQSQVSDQLRAQQLTLQDVGAICRTYEKLLQSQQSAVR